MELVFLFFWVIESYVMGGYGTKVYEVSQGLWLYDVELACRRQIWRTKGGEVRAGVAWSSEAEVFQ